ncbi:MAG: hypothetical protein IPK07_34600 [Deltaproteobacteria bacterium]|nr:hypothetical protein [Deltaproteobacteria bacterium]
MTMQTTTIHTWLTLAGRPDTLTVVFTRGQNFFIGPSTCDYCPVQSIWKRTFNKTTGALGPLVQLTDPSQPAGAKSIDCVSWMSSNRSLPLGDFDPDISPEAFPIDGDPSATGTRWVAFSRRFNTTVDAGQECDRAGDWDILTVDLNNPSPFLGANLKNLTGSDDGIDSLCPPLFGKPAGTGICADQIPNWSPIALAPGPIFRLAITTISGPPSGSFFDTSDIHVIAARTSPNNLRVNTQATAGADLNPGLSRGLVRDESLQSRRSHRRHGGPDLRSNRVERPGGQNQLRYLRADQTHWKLTEHRCTSNHPHRYLSPLVL